jgi:hypothetical protein
MRGQRAKNWRLHVSKSNQKLTKRIVDAAEPGGKEYEIRDSEVAGFL